MSALRRRRALKIALCSYWQFTVLGLRPGWTVTTLRHVTYYVRAVVAKNFTFLLRIRRSLKLLISGTPTLWGEDLSLWVGCPTCDLCMLFLTLGLCVVWSLGPDCPRCDGEELNTSMYLPWPCLCPIHVADVNVDLGGHEPQALPVSGAQPWFVLGLSRDFEAESHVASRLAFICAYLLEQTYPLWVFWRLSWWGFFLVYHSKLQEAKTICPKGMKPHWQERKGRGWKRCTGSGKLA